MLNILLFGCDIFLNQSTKQNPNSHLITVKHTECKIPDPGSVDSLEMNLRDQVQSAFAVKEYRQEWFFPRLIVWLRGTPSQCAAGPRLKGRREHVLGTVDEASATICQRIDENRAIFKWYLNDRSANNLEIGWTGWFKETVLAVRCWDGDKNWELQEPPSGNQSETKIYPSLISSNTRHLISLVCWIPYHTTWLDTNDDQKEDEEEGRERASSAGGPWVPVDKAIMDYHNWRTLEWVISEKADKTGTESPAKDWFISGPHPVILGHADLQSCK